MINYITENEETIDRSRLRKAEEVVINPNLPKEQRIKNYIEQIRQSVLLFGRGCGGEFEFCPIRSEFRGEIKIIGGKF